MRIQKISGTFFCVANIILLAALLAGCVAPAIVTEVKTELPVTANSASTEMTPPAVFQSKYLNPLDLPHGYIQNTCKYLRARWHPLNAQPGTVVMIIRLGAVYPGTAESTNGVDMDFGSLQRMLAQLKKQGFTAINTDQFLAFMERNVKIPPRSVLLVRDGQYGKEDFDKNFRSFWDSWKWPVVNGWTSHEDISKTLWQENTLMEYEGFVDHQARGTQFETYLTDDSSKVVIARELQGPLDPFAEHFAKTPIAYIWPNGSFGLRPVEIARQIGYQLGFTLNSRGPVMYNWVPQADQVDPQRPAYIPEAAIKDPLMTLPRYAPNQVLSAVDDVRVLGKEAAQYAQDHKAEEFEYYRIMCESTYGPIPVP